MFRKGWIALLVAGLLGGCSESPTAVATPQAIDTPPAAVATRTHQTITVLRDGKPDFELVPKDQTVEVHVGSTVYTGKVESDRIKVLDGDKQVVKVKRKKEGFEVEDAAGGRLLRVKVKAGPSLKVEDAQDKMVLQVDAAGPSLTVRAGDGAERGTVAAGPVGLEWTDASKTVRATLAGSDQIAVGLALTLESLKPEQRAAVALYLLEVGP